MLSRYILNQVNNIKPEFLQREVKNKNHGYGESRIIKRVNQKLAAVETVKAKTVKAKAKAKLKNIKRKEKIGKIDLIVKNMIDKGFTHKSDTTRRKLFETLKAIAKDGVISGYSESRIANILDVCDRTVSVYLKLLIWEGAITKRREGSKFKPYSFIILKDNLEDVAFRQIKRKAKNHMKEMELSILMYLICVSYNSEVYGFTGVKIARALNSTKSTICKYLKRLEENKYITVIKGGIGNLKSYKLTGKDINSENENFKLMFDLIVYLKRKANGSNLTKGVTIKSIMAILNVDYFKATAIIKTLVKNKFITIERKNGMDNYRLRTE